LRRKPPGRHPHPATGDLPAPRDRRPGRGRPLPGPRDRGRRRDRVRPAGPERPVTLEYDATVDHRGVETAFEVAEGETVALLGPNGAGKSTVLAVTAGLLRPDRGRIVLDGRRLTSRGDQDREVHVPPHDRQIALLAQEPLLFPHLTVLDNVAFGPRSAGSS